MIDSRCDIDRQGSVRMMRRPDFWRSVLKKVSFLLLVYFLTPKTVFRADFGGSMLDTSWALGLNMALKEGLTWGRDVVFTYGPLGYLTTRMPHLASKPMILAFFLFMAANAAYFIFHLLRRTGDARRLLPMLALLFLNAGFLYDTNSIPLFLYFIFHSWLFFRNGSPFSLAMLSIIALLSFFIKANTGVFVNVLFVLLCLVSRWTGRLGTFRMLAILFLHFGLVWVLSVILLVDLPGYLVNGWSIIDAYNDAMYIPADPFHLMCAVIALILLALPYLKSLKSVFYSPYESFMAFQLALFTFILFKQGYVRADGHVYQFLSGIPFVALMAYLSTSVEELRTNLRVSVVAVSMVSVLSLLNEKIIDRKIQGLTSNLGSPIRMSSKWSENDERKVDEARFPAEVVARVGDRGTDVLGCLISQLYFNGFKYDPRPVFQSYSAYSPRLIDLNHDKYAGEGAPDFVFYHFGTIDGRHKFWDEPKTYLPLMANYRATDTMRPKSGSPAFLLFERATQRKTVKERVVLDTVVGLNSWVTVPHSPNLLYMQMDCGLTLPGSIRRLFYQPPGVGMELLYEDGVTQTCRIILPVMKSGVPINRKVTTEQEAFEFFRSGGSRSKSTDSFKILADPFWVKGDVRLRFTEYLIGE